MFVFAVENQLINWYTGVKRTKKNMVLQGRRYVNKIL